MNRLKLGIPYAYILVGLLALFLLFVFAPKDGQLIDYDVAHEVSSDFFYNGGLVEGDLDITINEPYTLRTSLDEDFNQMQTLLIRTSLQNVAVHLEDQLVYTFNYDDELAYASMWHFVELPSHSESDQLSITYSSPYSSMSGVVNPVYYGDMSSLYMHLFNSLGIRLVIGLLTIGLGLFLVISSVFTKRARLEGYAYLGGFILFNGLWVISESRMLQLFTNRVFLLGALSYIALVMQIFPLALYVRNNVVKSFKNAVTLYAVLALLWIPLVIGLHLSGVLDFFESSVITVAFIVIGLFHLAVIFYLDYKRNHNQKIKKLIKYGIIILVAAVLEAIVYFSGNFDNTSVFVTTGIFFIIILVVINYVRFIINSYKMEYEKNIYEALAHRDGLTKAGNRLAFERDFNNISETLKTDEAIRIIYFDLNNLKHINDTFGHDIGDEAIINTYHVIKNVFGKLGHIYRLGGDEFICMISDCSEEICETLHQSLEQAVSEVNKKTTYPFELSFGFSLYKAYSNLTLSDVLKMADQNMYIDKRKRKIHNKT